MTSSSPNAPPDENAPFEAEFSRAKQLMQQKLFSEAETCFREMTAKWPKQARAWSGLAGCMKRQRCWTEALACWTEVIERFPEKSNPYQQRAGILIKLQRYEQAAEEFDKACACFPKNMELLKSRAKFTQQQGRMREAFQHWQAVLHKKPNNIQALLSSAYLLTQQGFFAQADKFLLRAAKRYDRNCRVWCRLVNSARKLRQHELALQRAKDTLEHFPNNAASHIEYANTLSAQCKFQEAEAELLHITARWPDNYQAFTAQAQLAEKCEEHELAAQYWETICKRFPNRPSSWLGLCRALNKVYRSEEALKICQQQIQRTNDLELKIQLLEFYQDRCAWKDAFALADEITTEHPKDPRAFNCKAALLINYSEPSTISTAIQILRQFELEYPDHISIRAALAKALISADKKEDALLEIKRLPEECTIPKVLSLRSWAASQHGDIGTAKELWQQIIDTDYYPVFKGPLQSWNRVDRNTIDITSHDILLFAPLKNQMRRLPWFLEHYRQLGVNRFFLVDNNSTDGSREFLLAQSDVYLFWSNDQFAKALSGMRWINFLIDQYGRKNWCLYVDLDEVLVFPGVEGLGLRHLIGYMESKGHEVLSAFMLDMHPENLASGKRYSSGQDPLEHSPYFLNDYIFKGARDCPYRDLSGGIRKSLFDERCRNTKTPLISGSSGTRFLNSSHRVTPAVVSDVTATLLHFKFLGDLDGFSDQQLDEKSRIPNVHQRYARYAKHLEKLPKERSLLSTRSVRFTSSEQLVDLGLLHSPPGYRTKASVYPNRYTISINLAVPNIEAAQRWGDYGFARSLQRVFECHGHRVRINLKSTDPSTQSVKDDISITLRGRAAYEPDPQCINLLWLISHPGDISVEELNGYEHVFVASEYYAGKLTDKTKAPVEALLQCTDPSLFYPDTRLEPLLSQVLFVGNSRDTYREIVRAAIEQGLDIDIYGEMWEKFLPKGYLKGRHIKRQDVREYYARCGVLLNDHWADMRDKGFLSNRLFDAAASGASIISDEAIGIKNLFGDAVITYSDTSELSAKVQQGLAHRNSTFEKRIALATTIRQEHSFQKRAERILEVATKIIQSRKKQIEVSDAR